MKYRIAVFSGDGVGPELISEGMKLAEKAAELDKFEIEWVMYPHGGEHYMESKESLSEKILKEISDSCAAIYCGPFDRIEGLAPEKNTSATIKNYFDQFVSLRPIKLLQGVESPLSGKNSNDINFVVIRENTEDFYVGAQGRAKNGRSKQQLNIGNSSFKAKFGLGIESKGDEIAYQIGILSRKGCDRIVKYAFDYAKNKSKKKLNFIDKADSLDCYGIWRESVVKIAKDYEGVDYGLTIINTAVMQIIRQPEKFGVIVAPNMFGDILQDIGTMLQGGLSFGARANINPEKISMFEPVHGSASKLREKGIVNPIATIWAAALMLENIGQQNAGDLTIKAIESVLREGRTKTQDLDGHNSTSEMADAIVDKLVELHD